MIHVGGRDANAEARWAALHVEMCETEHPPSGAPGGSDSTDVFCRPANIERLKELDIGS